MTKEEAITIMSDIRSEYNCFSHVEGGRYHALSMGIEALKERKHGKWLERDCGQDVECKCSVCGYKDFIQTKFDRYWFDRNFCPACGADMRQKDGET